jgi:hypothetical protein
MGTIDECLYLQMLSEHFEEALDFPAVPVDSANGGRTKAKVVGRKFNFTPGDLRPIRRPAGEVLDTLFDIAPWR